MMMTELWQWVNEQQWTKRDLQRWLLLAVAGAYFLHCLYSFLLPYLSARIQSQREKAKTLEQVQRKIQSSGGVADSSSKVAHDSISANIAGSAVPSVAAKRRRHIVPNYEIDPLSLQELRLRRQQQAEEAAKPVEDAPSSSGATSSTADNAVVRKVSLVRRRETSRPPLSNPISVSTNMHQLSFTQLRAQQDAEYERCKREDEEKQQKIAEQQRKFEEKLQNIRDLQPAEPETQAAEDRSKVITLSFRIKNELKLDESKDSTVVEAEGTAGLRIVKRRFHIEEHNLKHLLYFVLNLYIAHVTQDSEPVIEVKFNYPRLSFSQQSEEIMLEKSLQDADITADSVVWVHVRQ